MMRGPFKAAERLGLSGIQNEVTNVLERLWQFGTNAMPFGSEFSPPVEVWEELDHYTVVAELPGVDLSGLEVTAGPSSVTIQGDKRRPEPAAVEGAAAYPRLVQDERRYSPFSRTVALPGPVRTEGVSATMNNGLLTIQLPKLSGLKPVEIRVDVRNEPPPPAAPGM